MKRWRSALGPCAVVVTMNAAAIARDRSSFETCVRGLGPYEFAVLAVSAVCAALLGAAQVRGARPWVLLIPALPCVTALLGAIAKLHEAEPTLVRDALATGIGTRELSVIEVFKEAGRLRSLGALEGIALATAWLASSAPTWWPRDGVRRASASLAALFLTLAAAGLYGPVVAALRTGAADAYLLTLMALGVLGPALLTLTFRPRAAEAVDPSDTRRVVVRVTGPWSARVRNPLSQRDGVVDLHTWRPDAHLGSVVVVVPERDDVLGVVVVSAARRLRDGRVLLGWRGEPRSPTRSQ